MIFSIQKNQSIKKKPKSLKENALTFRGKRLGVFLKRHEVFKIYPSSFGQHYTPQFLTFSKAIIQSKKSGIGFMNQAVRIF